MAQCSLGFCYELGITVLQDNTQAVHWYQQAANGGLAEAQINLGVCFVKGQGVAQDDTQAVHWYQQAAKQGHATTQFNLGVCYEKGKRCSSRWHPSSPLVSPSSCAK